MTNLSVRKLDEETVRRLRIRAAHHGVSMEEEVRQILFCAVTVPQRLGDMALEYFGQNNGIELDIPEKDSHHPTEFSE